MPKTTTKTKAKTKASDTRSFEAQLWEACEAQRGSVNASRYKTFDLAADIPLYQREVFGSTAWRKSYSRRGTGVEPHFGALKDEAVAGFTRGKVRMRGIIKTGLMVAVAVAVTNRRFAMAWDRKLAPSPHQAKPKDKLRDPYHHRLTRISRQVGNTLEVLHPLVT